MKRKALANYFTMYKFFTTFHFVSFCFTVFYLHFPHLVHSYKFHSNSIFFFSFFSFFSFCSFLFPTQLSQGQTKNTQQFFNDIALDCNKRIEKQTATLDELEKIVKVKPTDISFNQALYDVLNNQFESFLDVSLELSKFHDEVFF